jgi:putative DNA primase/helicase
MTARAIVLAYLDKTAEFRTSKNGNQFATFAIRENVNGKTRWWRVISFSEDVIDALKEMAPGSPISVAGEIDAEIWSPPSGEARINWRLTCDAVLRADGKRKPRAERAGRFASRAADRARDCRFVMGRSRREATLTIRFHSKSEKPLASAVAPPDESQIVGSADTRPPAFSDEALALRFAERHADLRFVAAWNKWLIWDGARWRFDDTLHAFDLARHVCREAARECNDQHGASIASARTRGAVEHLARSDRRIAATINQWDADPWLLNTPDGVVDLRTGKARTHRGEDYMTKITAVGPRGGCPRFLAFLDRIAGGDSELVSYLQRMFGYALTGITREHALFFGYGTGANGKSVLMSTVSGALGDYHKTAPIEAFIATNGDRIPNDIAGLRGARLVTATETEEGRRWAEAKIKSLTGGDKIAARFMRAEWFEFLPAFKLVIAGNHKPSLRSVDEAIRRRFHLIPFAVTIPPEERDGELTEKLKAEWPGILAWMIEGCSRWQNGGLQPPQAVHAATEAYLAVEDAIAAWIDDKCDRDPNAWSSSAELFASWTAWATAAGEPVGSQKRFSQTLETRNFTRRKTEVAQGFLGLRVRKEPDPRPW